MNLWGSVLSDEDLLNDIQAAPLPGLNAPFGARCFLTILAVTGMITLLLGLNASFGARRFLTIIPILWESTQIPGLNAPFGARCFLTGFRAIQRRRFLRVLMHLLVLGAF